MNKACLQDQEVLAQANNTFQTTASAKALQERKNRKKFFSEEKNFFSRGFYTSLSDLNSKNEKKILQK